MSDNEMLYDGSFDLDFLRPGEYVSAVGDSSTDCLVHARGSAINRHPPMPIRLSKGDRLVRNADGTLSRIFGEDK